MADRAHKAGERQPHRTVYLDYWAAMWNSRNKIDGLTGYIISEDCYPKLFRSRRDCRAWIRQKYGYIATRPDLRREPHAWRVPRAVKVTVTVEARNGG